MRRAKSIFSKLWNVIQYSYRKMMRAHTCAHTHTDDGQKIRKKSLFSFVDYLIVFYFDFCLKLCRENLKNK